MFVVVHHRISDPDRFWPTVRKAMPNLPEDLTLEQCLPRADGVEAMCVWDADSLAAVRAFVEGTVGNVSMNEYFRAEHGSGVHLPSKVPA